MFHWEGSETKLTLDQGSLHLKASATSRPQALDIRSVPATLGARAGKATPWSQVSEGSQEWCPQEPFPQNSMDFCGGVGSGPKSRL